MKANQWVCLFLPGYYLNFDLKLSRYSNGNCENSRFHTRNILFSLTEWLQLLSVEIKKKKNFLFKQDFSGKQVCQILCYHMYVYKYMKAYQWAYLFIYTRNIMFSLTERLDLLSVKIFKKIFLFKQDFSGK